MKAGFLLLWLTAIWKFLRNKYRFVYFNTKYYNHSLKVEPVSRIYDLYNTHFLGELQDKSNKNYLLALKFKKNIWKLNNLDQNSINDLHKFSWLNYVNANKDLEYSRNIIQGWLDNFSNYNSKIWHPTIIAHRLIFWISNTSSTIRSEDLVFRTKVVHNILKQTLHLSKNISLISNKLDRVLAIFSLILVSTSFEGYKKLLDSSLKKLNELVKELIDKKGLVRSKSVEDQFWLLHHLIAIKESLKISQNLVPETLEDNIEIVGKNFVSLLYANNTIPLFNGSKFYDCSNFLKFIKLKGYKFDNSSNDTNFLFGKVNKLEVCMDTNSPPPDAHARHYQAGCLSFELLYNGTKVITNSGSAKNFSKELSYLAQSTAAHSCLTINDTSSCLFQKNSFIKKYYGDALLQRLKINRKEFVQNSITATLGGGHDGYLKKYSTLFDRTISMNGGDNIIQGEDLLTVSENDYAFLNFSIRFHVLPDAKLIKTNGGDVLISIKNQGWKFKSEGQNIKIESSLYFAEHNKIQETSCILIEGTLKQTINKILWSIEKTN